MSKYFACSGVKWTCTCGGHGTIQSPNKVTKVTLTDGDIQILTHKDKPPSLGSGICSVRNGNLCTPQVLPLWHKISKITCCGNRALLDGSSISCLHGGMITIKVPMQGAIEYDDCFFSRLELSSFPKPYQEMLKKRAEQQGTKAKRPKKYTQKASTFHMAVNNSKVKKYLSKNTEDNGMAFNKAIQISEPVASVRSDPALRLEPTPPPIPSAALLRQKHWCSGNCPEEYENTCGFRCAPCQLRFENDSGNLKKNLRNAHSSLYEIMVNISDNQNFSIAHHHLIPGNECYGKMDGDHHRYELLLKLGYFFDYDVNKDENGILLPAPKNSNGTEKVNNTEDARAEQYYNLMDKDLHNNNLFMEFSQRERGFIGSQLHCGPHTYEGALNNLRKEHPEARNLRSYESIVIAELDLLSDFYMDMYEDTCFMRDYEKNKKEFFNRINNASKRLRERINQFPNKGKALSFLNKRVYVSFPAILYDMNISLEEYQKKYLNPKNNNRPPMN